jgi:translation initiation factor 2 subunit 2
MDYDNMLDRAYSKVDKVGIDNNRLQIPDVMTSFNGSYTEFKNFQKVSKSINRNPEELLTYFKDSLATSGSLIGESAQFKGQFSEEELEQNLISYFNQYVECSQCGSPDTKYVERSGVEVIKCTACGADNTKPES